MDKGSKLLSDIVFLRTYAATLADGKKETRTQTIDRVKDMHIKKFPHLKESITDAFKWVHSGHVVPSMRTFQFAGEAIERSEARGYNCSYAAITKFKDIADLMWLLANGCGTGYSVQAQHVDQLPVIKEGNDDLYFILDNKESWADSVLILLENPNAEFNYEFIRRAGSPLSTGGTASGPEPLRVAHEKIRAILKAKVGWKLNPIEVHRIMCAVADCIIVGGVRRCLPFDARVHTKRGMTRIQDVRIGDVVQTSKGYETVTNVFEQGAQETVKIQTDAGVLECTPNHRVAVISGYQQYVWKMAKDLLPTDRLVFTNVALESSLSGYPQEAYEVSKHAHTLKNVTIPTLSANQAWLVGYIQGNGYVDIHEDGEGKRHGNISIAVPQNAPERLLKVEEAIKEFGINTRTIEGTGEVFCVRVASMRLASYLLEHVKAPKTEMSVPDFIFMGSYEQRAAYLCGLFDADGAANNRPVSLSSVYPDFLRSVQSLAASLAIPSYVKLNRAAKGEWQDLFHLCFKSSGRTNLAKALETFGTKTIPSPTGNQRSYSYPSAMVPEKRYPKHLNVSVDMLDLDSQPFVPVKIIEIGAGRTVPTFDIEVKNVHEFYADGFLVHNSAMIAFFDCNDREMLTSKSGTWWEKHPEYARANISAVLNRKDLDFDSKLTSIINQCFASNSGEPGISLTNDFNMGSNPCHEIALKDGQLCNLSEINAAACKNEWEFLGAAVAAATIGTLQASYTDFKYIQPKFSQNCKDEALLGVSITGQAEAWDMLDDQLLQAASDILVRVNAEWANRVGINPAARIGCVKPSGTTSAFLGTTSGIHAAHAPYYIRRVRIGVDDPVALHLVGLYGVGEAESRSFIEKDKFNPANYIISLPIAKDGSIQRDEESAVELLNRSKHVYNNWILPSHQAGVNTHNVSLTVNYKPEDCDQIVQWMLDHRQSYAGISLLPFDGGSYVQAPFEEISEGEYLSLLAQLPDNVDFSTINFSAQVDKRAEIAACAGGSCEIS